MTADRDRDKFLTIPDPGHLDFGATKPRSGESWCFLSPRRTKNKAPDRSGASPPATSYFGQGTADLVSAFSSG
jgi:hypothetical protein